MTDLQKATLALNTNDVLARTLWAEARGEGQAGMEAVACVILNRAAHPRWWGRDIRGVCLAPMQFSCWLPEPTGQLHRMLALTGGDPLYKQAQAIAAAAIGGKLVDRTGGADTYANLAACDPVWARGVTPCAKIGHHTFFRLELAAAHGSVTSPSQAMLATHPANVVQAVESPTTAELNDAEIARLAEQD